MSTFKDIDAARAYFSGDRFAVENGMVIDELTDEGSVCSFAVTSRHKNAMGNAMGGAIFTLADFAFAVAANHRHHPTVAQQVSVNFLNAGRGARLIARARPKKDGRGSCVYNVDITDDEGRDVAQIVITGFKLPESPLEQ